MIDFSKTFIIKSSFRLCRKIIMKIKMPRTNKEKLSVLKWLVDSGGIVEAQQCIMLLESQLDEDLFRLCSPIDGKITEIIKSSGFVKIGDVLAEIESVENNDDKLLEIPPNMNSLEKIEQQNVLKQSEQSYKRASDSKEKSENITKENELMSKGNPEKVIPILMPKAGQSVEEASLVKWNVKVGDEIKEGQIIFEIETDKATIEVEATDSGKLAKIVVEEGEVVPVLTPVAYLADNQSDLEAYLASQNESIGQTDSAHLEEQNVKTDISDSSEQIASSELRQDVIHIDGERIKASPAAKKLAREKGVDLRSIKTASGPGGRIIIQDVESAIASGLAQKAVKTHGGIKAGEGIARKLTPMRKAIAKNLTFSKQNVPHFYMKITIAADSMYEFYQTRRKQYKCSVNDVIISACAKVIMEFSAFRSRMESPDELMEYSSANIGIAVGLDNGLVVPVVLNVEQYSFEELAKETRRIIKTAREGKPENMGKGVFTISNLGMYDVDEFSAIINPPEAAILAVGGMKENVIVENGAIRIGKTMSLTLSCDHRVIDGLLAAQFLGRLKNILENPAEYIK